MRRARVVTVISEAVREALEREIPEARGKTRVIPIPLMPGFAPDPRPWPADRPVRVLLLGSAWNKNHARQIRALGGLDVEATLVGTPDDETRAALEALETPPRLLVGLSDDAVREEYRRCDLVLFASLYEGFGMPIVEAQATGRPVVTSARAPMNDVAGEAAVLVNPDSEEAIREGVRRVMDDAALRAGLVERGYANVRRYDSGAVAALYVEAYRDALAP